MTGENRNLHKLQTPLQQQTVLKRRAVLLLVSLVAYSLIPVVGGLLRSMELLGGAALVPENPRALAAPLPIIAHALASAIFCLGGALQILPGLTRRRPAWHRSFGYVVVLAGCVSAGTGLWMTLYFSFPAELQGSALYVVRLLLGYLMIGLLAWAVLAARAGEFGQHAAAMLRAYAIGLGASTQSFLGLGWMLLSGSELLGPVRDGVMILAWALNLACAEYLIARFLPAQTIVSSRPQPEGQHAVHGQHNTPLQYADSRCPPQQVDAGANRLTLEDSQA